VKRKKEAEVMSNLAVKIQQKQQEKHLKVQKNVPIVKRRARVTLGEKCLAVLFVGMVLIGGIKIVSNSVALYETNLDIQKLEAKIQNQQRVNNDLKVQVKELSTYERIWAKAKELGLALNENNVKVVQD
jgi:cell division protein FtsL